MHILRQVSRQQWVEWCVVAFLVFAVLWRGGKSIDSTWVLVGITAFVVLMFPSRKNQNHTVPIELWIAVMAFMVWSVLSYVQSATANYGLDEVCRTISFGLIFLWAVRYAQGEEGRLFERGLTKFIRVFCVVTLSACAIGVVVYIFQPVDRFVGTFFDYRFHTDYWPNAWANYVLLAWPVLYYWAFSNSRCFISFGRRNEQLNTSYRIIDFSVRVLVVSFVIACLFLSYSRGGMIAFGGQLTLWASMTYLQMKDRVIWKKIAATVAVIFAMAFLVFQAMNIARANIHEVVSVSEKVTFTSDEGNSSVSERSQFWGQALDLSIQRPLFGWGPYSFRFVQPHIQEGVLATSDHAHNVFLKYASEIGWPSAILFLFIVVYTLVRAIDVELKKGIYGHSPLGTLLLLSIAGVISHSLIDYNLQFVGIAFPFWILLGFLAGHVSMENRRSVPRAFSKYIEVLIASVLLSVALIEGGYLVVSSVGRHAEVNGDTRNALRWYEKAKGQMFSRDLFLSKATILLNEGNYTAAEQSVRRYLEYNSQDARAWKLLGMIAASKQDFDSAIEFYETAYTYGKYNDIGITLGLVQSYLAKGDEDAVNSRKNEIDMLLTAYGNAIIQNSHFIALSANVEQFVSLCEVFIELYPNEAPVYVVLAAKADDHGKLERERIKSRPPGFLW